MIETAGRFHAIDTDHVVAGANEIIDDNLHKKQSVVNAENESFKEAQTELNEAQSDFNSEVRDALGTGGNVDERIVNAVNTETTRAEAVEESLDGRVETLESAVGTGGSVDSRISAAVNAAKSEIKGNATSACDTLGEAEALISAEATRAQAAETDRYTKSETYTKEEVHNLITTPSQEYVSVTATAQTTAVTDVLPATGAADTTYRVGNWDGTQYNDSVFSEYAWNGSTYIKLSTKSQIGEVYDISANHADTKYADLAAALGTNGANIPQSLQKGGMSVKFVQSSDNTYVQYRLMSDEWSVDTEDWSFCGNDVYVENPEFIYVKTDNEDKVLWAIKTDGTIYYGTGCPPQVQKYVQQQIDAIGIDTLLATKVDKVIGKSLIDEDIASSQEFVENPEYMEVITDNNGNVLQGINKDGDTIVKNINLTSLNNTVNVLSAIVNSKNITKLCLPSKFIFELGKTYQLFKRSMFKGIDYRNYDIQVVFPNSSTQQEIESCKDYDRYVQYTPTSTGEINVIFLLFDTNRNLLDEKEVVFKTIQHNTQPSTMQTVLFIGDSLTAYNRISDEFYRLLTSNDESSTVQDTLSIYNVKKPAGRNWGNIELIGTQKNNYLGWTGQTYNEGYSGWKWYHFIHSGSPFVINGQIDFNGYLTANGFNTPNIVYIGLGWNDAINDAVVKDNGKDIDISAIMANARTFLNAITSQLPNTKIRLWTENITGIHGGIGNNTKSSTERFDEYLLNLIQFEIMEGYKTLILDYPNVDIVWSTAFFDSEYCLQEEEADINTRISNEEVRGKDYIHPADSGFFQIADSLVTDFCSLL